MLAVVHIQHVPQRCRVTRWGNSLPPGFYIPLLTPPAPKETVKRLCRITKKSWNLNPHQYNVLFSVTHASMYHYEEISTTSSTNGKLKFTRKCRKGRLRILMPQLEPKKQSSESASKWCEDLNEKTTENDKKFIYFSEAEHAAIILPKAMEEQIFACKVDEMALSKDIKELAFLMNEESKRETYSIRLKETSLKVVEQLESEGLLETGKGPNPNVLAERANKELRFVFIPSSDSLVNKVSNLFEDYEEKAAIELRAALDKIPPSEDRIEEIAKKIEEVTKALNAKPKPQAEKEVKQFLLKSAQKKAELVGRSLSDENEARPRKKRRKILLPSNLKRKEEATSGEDISYRSDTDFDSGDENSFMEYMQNYDESIEFSHDEMSKNILSTGVKQNQFGQQEGRGDAQQEILRTGKVFQVKSKEESVSEEEKKEFVQKIEKVVSEISEKSEEINSIIANMDSEEFANLSQKEMIDMIAEKLGLDSEESKEALEMVMNSTLGDIIDNKDDLPPKERKEKMIKKMKEIKTESQKIVMEAVMESSGESMKTIENLIETVTDRSEDIKNALLELSPDQVANLGVNDIVDILIKQLDLENTKEAKESLKSLIIATFGDILENKENDPPEVIKQKLVMKMQSVNTAEGKQAITNQVANNAVGKAKVKAQEKKMEKIAENLVKSGEEIINKISSMSAEELKNLNKEDLAKLVSEQLGLDDSNKDNQDAINSLVEASFGDILSNKNISAEEMKEKLVAKTQKIQKESGKSIAEEAIKQKEINDVLSSIQDMNLELDENFNLEELMKQYEENGIEFSREQLSKDILKSGLKKPVGKQDEKKAKSVSKLGSKMKGASAEEQAEIVEKFKNTVEKIASNAEKITDAISQIDPNELANMSQAQISKFIADKLGLKEDGDLEAIMQVVNSSLGDTLDNAEGLSPIEKKEKMMRKLKGLKDESQNLVMEALASSSGQDSKAVTNTMNVITDKADQIRDLLASLTAEELSNLTEEGLLELCESQLKLDGSKESRNALKSIFKASFGDILENKDKLSPEDMKKKMINKLDKINSEEGKVEIAEKMMKDSVAKAEKQIEQQGKVQDVIEQLAAKGEEIAAFLGTMKAEDLAKMSKEELTREIARKFGLDMSNKENKEAVEAVIESFFGEILDNKNLSPEEMKKKLIEKSQKVKAVGAKALAEEIVTKKEEIENIDFDEFNLEEMMKYYEEEGIEFSKEQLKLDIKKGLVKLDGKNIKPSKGKKLILRLGKINLRGRSEEEKKAIMKKFKGVAQKMATNSEEIAKLLAGIDPNKLSSLSLEEIANLISEKLGLSDDESLEVILYVVNATLGDVLTNKEGLSPEAVKEKILLKMKGLNKECQNLIMEAMIESGGLDSKAILTTMDYFIDNSGEIQNILANLTEDQIKNLSEENLLVLISKKLGLEGSKDAQAALKIIIEATFGDTIKDKNNLTPEALKAKLVKKMKDAGSDEGKVQIAEEIAKQAIAKEEKLKSQAKIENILVNFVEMGDEIAKVLANMKPEDLAKMSKEDLIKVVSEKLGLDISVFENQTALDSIIESCFGEFIGNDKLSPKAKAMRMVEKLQKIKSEGPNGEIIKEISSSANDLVGKPEGEMREKKIEGIVQALSTKADDIMNLISKLTPSQLKNMNESQLSELISKELGLDGSKASKDLIQTIIQSQLGEIFENKGKMTGDEIKKKILEKMGQIKDDGGNGLISQSLIIESTKIAEMKANEKKIENIMDKMASKSEDILKVISKLSPNDLKNLDEASLSALVAKELGLDNSEATKALIKSIIQSTFGDILSNKDNLTAEEIKAKLQGKVKEIKKDGGKGNLCKKIAAEAAECVGKSESEIQEKRIEQIVLKIGNKANDIINVISKLSSDQIKNMSVAELALLVAKELKLDDSQATQDIIKNILNSSVGDILNNKNLTGDEMKAKIAEKIGQIKSEGGKGEISKKLVSDSLNKVKEESMEKNMRKVAEKFASKADIMANVISSMSAEQLNSMTEEELAVFVAQKLGLGLGEGDNEIVQGLIKATLGDIIKNKDLSPEEMKKKIIENMSKLNNAENKELIVKEAAQKAKLIGKEKKIESLVKEISEKTGEIHTILSQIDANMLATMTEGELMDLISGKLKLDGSIETREALTAVIRGSMGDIFNNRAGLSPEILKMQLLDKVTSMGSEGGMQQIIEEGRKKAQNDAKKDSLEKTMKSLESKSAEIDKIISNIDPAKLANMSKEELSSFICEQLNIGGSEEAKEAVRAILASTVGNILENKNLSPEEVKEELRKKMNGIQSGSAASNEILAEALIKAESVEKEKKIENAVKNIGNKSEEIQNAIKNIDPATLSNLSNSELAAIVGKQIGLDGSKESQAVLQSILESCGISSGDEDMQKKLIEKMGAIKEDGGKISNLLIQEEKIKAEAAIKEKKIENLIQNVGKNAEELSSILSTLRPEDLTEENLVKIFAEKLGLDVDSEAVKSLIKSTLKDINSDGEVSSELLKKKLIEKLTDIKEDKGQVSKKLIEGIEGVEKELKLEQGIVNFVANAEALINIISELSPNEIATLSIEQLSSLIAAKMNLDPSQLSIAEMECLITATLGSILSDKSISTPEALKEALVKKIESLKNGDSGEIAKQLAAEIIIMKESVGKNNKIEDLIKSIGNKSEDIKKILLSMDPQVLANLTSSELAAIVGKQLNIDGSSAETVKALESILSTFILSGDEKLSAEGILAKLDNLKFNGAELSKQLILEESSKADKAIKEKKIEGVINNMAKSAEEITNLISEMDTENLSREKITELFALKMGLDPDSEVLKNILNASLGDILDNPGNLSSEELKRELVKKVGTIKSDAKQLVAEISIKEESSKKEMKIESILQSIVGKADQIKEIISSLNPEVLAGMSKEELADIIGKQIKIDNSVESQKILLSIIESCLESGMSGESLQKKLLEKINEIQNDSSKISSQLIKEEHAKAEMAIKEKKLECMIKNVAKNAVDIISGVSPDNLTEENLIKIFSEKLGIDNSKESLEAIQNIIKSTMKGIDCTDPESLKKKLLEKVSDINEGKGQSAQKMVETLAAEQKLEAAMKYFIITYLETVITIIYEMEYTIFTTIITREEWSRYIVSKLNLREGAEWKEIEIMIFSVIGSIFNNRNLSGEEKKGQMIKQLEALRNDDSGDLSKRYVTDILLERVQLSRRALVDSTEYDEFEIRRAERRDLAKLSEDCMKVISNLQDIELSNLSGAELTKLISRKMDLVGADAQELLSKIINSSFEGGLSPQLMRDRMLSNFNSIADDSGSKAIYKASLLLISKCDEMASIICQIDKIQIKSMSSDAIADFVVRKIGGSCQEALKFLIEIVLIEIITLKIEFTEEILRKKFLEKGNSQIVTQKEQEKAMQKLLDIKSQTRKEMVQKLVQKTEIEPPKSSARARKAESESKIPSFFKPSSETNPTVLVEKINSTIDRLIKSEEEFVTEIVYIYETYYKYLDLPGTPRVILEARDLIFCNLKQIVEFHSSVFLQGIKYYARQFKMIVKTFLRLERDFDKYVTYCKEIIAASKFLEENKEVSKYFEEYRMKIKDTKSLSEWLQTPILRLSQYKLYLNELGSYATSLKEDTSEMEKAFEMVELLPQKSTDLKFLNNIEGFPGDTRQLGRILKHDLLTYVDSEGKSHERYVFLFKTYILITKIKRISETRSIFQYKTIITLSNAEITETSERYFSIYDGKYTYRFETQLELIKIWLSELRRFVREKVYLNTSVSRAESSSRASLRSEKKSYSYEEEKKEDYSSSYSKNISKEERDTSSSNEKFEKDYSSKWKVDDEKSSSQSANYKRSTAYDDSDYSSSAASSSKPPTLPELPPNLSERERKEFEEKLPLIFSKLKDKKELKEDEIKTIDLLMKAQGGSESGASEGSRLRSKYSGADFSTGGSYYYGSYIDLLQFSSYWRWWRYSRKYSRYTSRYRNYSRYSSSLSSYPSSYRYY